jgi:hypothetical protein
MHLGERGIHEPPAERRVVDFARPAIPATIRLGHDVRRASHRFDASADEHVPIADRDRVRRRIDGLEAGAAQAIDRLAADLDREARQQRRHSGDIAVVLAGLVRAAEDDVLDEHRIEAGAVHHRPEHEGGKVVGSDARQRTAVAPDRRPDRLDDPGLTNGPLRVTGHALDRSGSGVTGPSRSERGERRKEPIRMGRPET